jgi:heme-degrading monooxygenase HmoA
MVMVKGWNRMLRSLLVLLMATLMGALAWPTSSWADKVASPLVFDSAAEAIAVISLYETTPTSQPDALKALLKTSKSFYKKMVGFDSFALFSSTDGNRILELTQWQDQPSYEAFKASLTAGDAEDYTKYYEKYTKAKTTSGSASLTAPEPLITASFVVDQVVAPPGLLPLISGENSLVQVSELRAETADQQEALLTSATTALASLPSLYPSPRSAILLRSTDSADVAVLTNWGNAAEFSDIAQVPQFSIAMAEPSPSQTEALEDQPEAMTTPSPEELTVSAITQDDRLYQVVKIIAPKTSKYEKDSG